MDEYLFKIDGRGFSGVGVEAVKRSFRIPDGPNAGSMLSGDYTRDIVGTYYDYDLTLTAEQLPDSEYNALYEILSSPVESHTVEMPYGLSGITFEAMIEAGTDELIPMDDGTWWGNLSLTIRAKKPQRAAP